MDFNPFQDSANFVDLLNSQQKVFFGNIADTVPLSSSEGPKNVDEATAERKERKTWTPTDDIVLISSWLNMSKDPVVGNEQSPKVAGTEKIEGSQCKQRWHKLNDLVCKFCGAYEAATRERTSGMNENDVVKSAHEIFFSNHEKRFTLEHAWHELRNDQKWCEVSTAKTKSSSKRRKFGDGQQSASSHVNENDATVDDDGRNHPAGVKAAKARGKRPMGEGKQLSDFQTMWSIKRDDLAMKERLSKMKLLESLVAKQVPLADYEEALKKKLIDELISS
ncbi:PREDICTED: glutathione S-transferase T3-like [Brassica oleracea var. oleracea]|nr:PREDICTED: glutathione S-transferase T3-like [Brassica oleracea var. oleracea]